MDFSPQARILTLGDGFYDRVTPADFPQTVIRFRNDRAATEVGLEGLTDAEWSERFGRFRPFDRSLPEPLALRYHGHQFRVYNPDIGDGRGFTYAQLRDTRGRLMDLGTKGSGQTPWSRFGDGRLTLKGGVREVLATEMLEALGADTSRSFSLIETGESLHRGDEPSPTRSSVLVRLSHGHIRIGSFQRLATLQDDAGLEALARYALTELYGEEPAANPALQLFGRVVERTAKLAASYMVAGFVHGVLNSDNINVTGESFDYGPWRFTPMWDNAFTAAYFDQQGLYAFGRQAQAIHWDVAQLAIALSRITGVDPLAVALDRFPAIYEEALVSGLLKRLGVKPRGEGEDIALADALVRVLQQGTVTIDRVFFDWRGGRLRASQAAYDNAAFQAFAEAVRSYEQATALDHPYWSDAEPCSMHIEEVEAIWAPIAEADDWSLFTTKVASIRRMGAALA
ncbi:YdiU family protein [Sphingomonas sp. CGMCC 1.13654]|uniref:Protein nucleotidyltransferase YdiU n=1 Tax=Sphingomonas chungangi TaxID=2683589 RepID=A0A838L489_9SPHN|nr:YdiU family protein [Sphingomonas chungangi]MBA2933016.1 YdiU family protein [Sphingomonas chungangi]MVW56636.1 YdiU family protein [Sphingomonas chungangi]